MKAASTELVSNKPGPKGRNPTGLSAGPLEAILQTYAAQHVSKSGAQLVQRADAHPALKTLIDINPKIHDPAQNPRYAERDSKPSPGLMLIGEFFGCLNEEPKQVELVKLLRPKIVWDQTPHAVLFDFKPYGDQELNFANRTFTLRVLSAWDGEYWKAIVDIEEVELDYLNGRIIQARGNISGSADRIPPHFRLQEIPINGRDFIIHFEGLGHNPRVILQNDTGFGDKLGRSESDYAFLLFDLDKDYFYLEPHDPGQWIYSFFWTAFGWKVPEVWTVFWRYAMLDALTTLKAKLPMDYDKDEFPFLTNRGATSIPPRMQGKLRLDANSVRLEDILVFLT